MHHVGPSIGPCEEGPAHSTFLLTQRSTAENHQEQINCRAPKIDHPSMAFGGPQSDSPQQTRRNTPRSAPGCDLAAFILKALAEER